ncbi:MAG: sugar phosphate nucleotidyltransferase [Bacteroidetes bacterium]|nr:sugar phosphate nucleotidyltransferase [Bacteroidota bacterium]MCL5737750.1 sugar phosphate nucleotidyltransferase [Bacteroidota bacterium]
MHTTPFQTVILAAGKGKRMKNPDLPKVMYKVNGKPMVDHVVELAHKLGSLSVIAIVGFKREVVIDHLREAFGNEVTFAVQEEQLGTGHAVMQIEQMLKDFNGDVLVLSGDVPLLTEKTMRQLLKKHQESGAVMTVLTAKINDPTGYGRIIRLSDGHVDRIAEEKDAAPEEKKIDEINSGIYVFKCKELFDALHHLSPENAQHEYYLTDVLGYFAHHGMRVSAVLAKHFDEIRGVNTVDQLSEAEKALQTNNEVFGS